jgi:hypothetical protein
MIRAIFYDNSRIGYSTVKIYDCYPDGGRHLMYHFATKDTSITKKISLLKSLIHTFKTASIFIDATGMGEIIYEQLKAVCSRVKQYY